MLYNLEQALGDETTPEEREEIARKAFFNMFTAIGELIHIDSISARWQERFKYEGAEHVERMIEPRNVSLRQMHQKSRQRRTQRDVLQWFRPVHAPRRIGLAHALPGVMHPELAGP